MNRHTSDELREIYAALDALPARERMIRLADACIELDQTLPASIYLIVIASVMGAYLSTEKRNNLAVFMRGAASQMLGEEAAAQLH